MAPTPTHPIAALGGPAALLIRATCFGAGAGAAIGGVLGTLDWPVVGTFLGALVGVVAGSAIGLLDGLVLLGVSRATRSAWLARLCSAAVTLGTLLAVSSGGDFGSPAGRGGDGVLVAVGVLVGGALGPFVAYGAEPTTLRAGGAPRPLAEIAAMVLPRAALAGAVLGAISGFVIGTRVYLATSPVAAVEGAVLGAVSGVVLALLLGAVVVVPRLRARR